MDRSKVLGVKEKGDMSGREKESWRSWKKLARRAAHRPQVTLQSTHRNHSGNSTSTLLLDLFASVLALMC